MSKQHPTGVPEQVQRLRVAVLNRNFSATGGGAERYSIALVEHLAAQHEIHVFAQDINHQWPGVTYHQVSRPLRKPRWVNQLWYATVTWWVTRKGFDVVHSHENTWHGNVQTVHVLPVKYNLLHGLHGWRLMLRWLMIMTSPRLLIYLALERSRFSLRKPRIIVVTSQTLVPQILEFYPACRAAIQVVSPGVDHVPGVATTQEKLSARACLGLPSEGYSILFVGNDFRKKGLTALIDALPHLPGECFVAVVGNPAQVPQFRAQAIAAGVVHRVHFLGFLTDVHVAYQASDCLAHPTLEDTFAMVVLEAMAHGLPVVVSAERYCGIAALLSHQVNALVLDDPQDTLALAAALGLLVKDQTLRSRISLTALEFTQNHQWTALAGIQERCYRLLVRRSTG